MPIVSRDINPSLPALVLAEPDFEWMNVLGTKITVLNMLQDLWLSESVTIRQEEENVLETMCAWRIYSSAHPLGYQNQQQQQSLAGSC